MMHCSFCKNAAHTKSSRYMSEQVKELYHQCTNLDFSCTFKTNESITKLITGQPQPEKVPAPPPEPVRDRQTLAVMVQHSARLLMPHSRCLTSGFFMSVLCLFEALFLASRFVKSDACIACMDLHAKSCTAFYRSAHTRRGSARIMHLHEKRCLKRPAWRG
ncbi:ogr/Delta-like zinc finger family protein [Pantoea agglomerans]|uniref:ogr/Delta-like zinc finger family protein n=1 Tax=Enterobacter agglomerans TaxID=549 RepID=UPI003C7D57A2